MAEFTDDFSGAADGTDLNGTNGWAVVDSAGAAAAAALEHHSGQVTNALAADAYMAHQGTTVPTGAPQQARAVVLCTSEAANSTIDVGVMQRGTTSGMGIFARLEYRSSGDRYLSLWERLESAENQLAEIQVADGGYTANGIVGKGQWLEGETIDEERAQDLRVLVTSADQGFLIRGYLNQPDDDLPTLAVHHRFDLVDNGGGIDYGEWWFRFGDNGEAETFYIGWFFAEDYALATRLAGVVQDNTVELGTVIDRVKRIHTGAVNDHNLDETRVVEAIADALIELQNEAGDQAWFLKRNEELTPSWDASGFYDAPAYMKRILEWRLPNSRCVDRVIQFYGLAPSTGQLRFSLSARSTQGGPYMVLYLVRQLRPQNRWDPLYFPVEHIEALVWGAILRLAQEDGSGPWLQTAIANYDRLSKQFRADLARHSDQNRVRYQPPRSRHFPKRWRYSS